jgi:hypothetical protein
VNQVNQLLGETNEVERAVLFIGTGTKNTGKTLAVNTQSDFDALLGEDDSQLKGMCWRQWQTLARTGGVRPCPGG